MTNQNNELPNILNISDDFTYATFYHKYFDTGKYIYSTHTGAWFCYDKDNVLTLSCTKTPLKLKNEIFSLILVEPMLHCTLNLANVISKLCRK